MKTRLTLVLLAALTTTTTARAARLVVMAVNSGQDITAPYVNISTPNLLPPGAKGFLIGIDLQDDLVDIPLGVQDILFTNVVHQQGINDENLDPLPVPLNLRTRSQGQLQQINDALPVNNGYLRSDSYVMDNAQQGSFVWTPVGPGIEGGAPGDNFLRITAALGLPSPIDGPGVVQLAYIVVAANTGYVRIGGLIARGAVGFDVIGNPIAQSPQPYFYLDVASGQLVYIPEPSSLVLAGLGVIGLACVAWTRRK